MAHTGLEMRVGGGREKTVDKARKKKGERKADVWKKEVKSQERQRKK